MRLNGQLTSYTNGGARVWSLKLSGEERNKVAGFEGQYISSVDFPKSCHPIITNDGEEVFRGTELTVEYSHVVQSTFDLSNNSVGLTLQGLTSILRRTGTPIASNFRTRPQGYCTGDDISSFGPGDPENNEDPVLDSLEGDCLMGCGTCSTCSGEASTGSPETIFTTTVDNQMGLQEDGAPETPQDQLAQFTDWICSNPWVAVLVAFAVGTFLKGR